ncbi:hypothetical protein AAJCM20276_05020 [Acetobacter aceti]|uniref:Uncharacterized protein n=2 Tax=Acetobacter aceti TaxID=435 RepID=A0A6S6PDT7_ACEAC|nr:hypothetical protein AAJCM20276_05020 [Acetobacter aceti]
MKAKRKKYTSQDLNPRFREIYSDIIKGKIIQDDYSDNHEIQREQSLLNIFQSRKKYLKDEIERTIKHLKSAEWSNEFSVEVGRLGGQLGGLKRTFLQESKIYVIHALWPDAKFSGNVLMTISEKLFGNGFNRSFLHFKGHALGSEALFSGVSDPVPDISDDDIHQAGILMSILKKAL